MNLFMGLNISFDCRAYKEKLPNLEFGVHLILSDGCMIDLEEGNSNLTQAQKQYLDYIKKGNRKKHSLLYLNTKLVDRLFDVQGILKLFCPTCGNEYTLNRQDYQDSYEKFGRGE